MELILFAMFKAHILQCWNPIICWLRQIVTARKFQEKNIHKRAAEITGMHIYFSVVVVTHVAHTK